MTPVTLSTVPCRNTLYAVLFSPTQVNTSVSAASEAFPVADRLAPPDAAPKLLQPRPGPEGGLPQGQPITPPTPGSQKEVSPTPVSVPSSVQPVIEPVSAAHQSTMFRVHVPAGPAIELRAVLLITYVPLVHWPAPVLRNWS